MSIEEDIVDFDHAAFDHALFPGVCKTIEHYVTAMREVNAEWKFVLPDPYVIVPNINTGMFVFIYFINDLLTFR